uniref:Uncharacterized protein n=1 Tax=uncultured bacterium contig00085 TaxID=1181558 RepID=A0A806KCU1_9BACT|nr:hypothetical protein [uncultured bacterium contig00085]
MATEKDALIEKLTGVFNYITKFYELTNERIGYEQTLSEHRKELQTLESCIEITPGEIRGHVIKGTISIAAILASWIFLNGILSVLVMLAGAVYLVYNIVKYFMEKSFLKSCIKEADDYAALVKECKEKIDGMGAKFGNLSDTMKKEEADTDELFPGDYVIQPRYVKHGIDMLRTGRADNFKEVLVRIDDFKFKESMEEKAEQAAQEAAAARSAASDAASAARSAASSASSAASSASSAASDASAAKWAARK